MIINKNVFHLAPTCNVQCQNGGSCFLTPWNQPKCRCPTSYSGERCEINKCRDYCQNGGTCSPSRTGTHPQTLCHFLHIYLYSYIINTICFLFSGAPTCRCQTGFTGSRCEQHTCNNYCQNEGTCTVSQGNQPTCRCPKGFLGDQCQYREFDSLSL